MERKLSFYITANEHNISILDFLKSQNFSSQNIIEIKKMHRSVLVNENWEHMNYKLQSGDHLLIHLQEYAVNEHILPVDLPFPIVYEDEDLVVVNKPADMPTHPSQNNYENTLANAAAYHYQTVYNTPFTFRCINRLDRDTTGLTILAKNMYSANLLARQMQNREIKRLYLALVDGHPKDKYGTIRLPIGRKPGSTIERQIDNKTGDSAITHYCRLTDYQNVSLMAFQLETGRTHQIRVHMSAFGHPLLGDTLYNPLPSAKLADRQCLHAYRISFAHPVTGQRLKLTAPLPEDMQTLINGLS